jgi:hypothetical protein
LVGVTAIDVTVAAVIVTVSVPLNSPLAAVIVAVPALTPVTRPEALTVATEASDELQVTCEPTSLVVLSENVPVAINCWVVPAANDGFVGVTAIDASVAAVTASVAEPLTFSIFAVMVVLPTITLVAFPEASTVATALSDDDHVAVVVTSFVVLLL